MFTIPTSMHMMTGNSRLCFAAIVLLAQLLTNPVSPASAQELIRQLDPLAPPPQRALQQGPAIVATNITADGRTNYVVGRGSRRDLSQRIPPFALKAGDTVALLGDALVEREGNYGYWETFMTGQFPDRPVTFRNLGWSADTPEGKSRVSFDWTKPPGEWRKQLLAQIAEIKPSVVFLGYGMAVSLAGDEPLEAFRTNYIALIDGIRQLDTNRVVRFVLMTPLRHQSLPAPLPDPTQHNETLAKYAAAIREIAAKGGHELVDLENWSLTEYRNAAAYAANPTNSPLPQLTENGIHLSQYGYWRSCLALARGLRLPNPVWRLGLNENGKLREGGFGASYTAFTRTTTNAQVTLKEDKLPMPNPPGKFDLRLVNRPLCYMQVPGLAVGEYALTVDGTDVLRGSESDWAKYRIVVDGPSWDQAEKLRKVIVKKNELFFNRWRPENTTYLFGFRKHEQGQNAKEIPEFDALIADLEKQINELKKPIARVYRVALPAQGTPRPAGTNAPPATLAPPADATKPRVEAAPTTPASPSPEFTTGEGIRVDLFAESPLLAKPIHMNFDPEGRLWIASSETYPQIKPGAQASDKILVLEDTDGDGRADKSTVFADGLLIPTGVAPGNGGVYVGQSTQLLFLKDNDGDGVADEKRIVLSGFGTEDTHHILHTLQWGPDGRLYMNQSIYIHSHLETPNGVARLNSGGIWRLDPATLKMEVFLRGFCNPWGHVVDAYGQSFVTDGAGFQGLSWGVPGAMYFTYANGRRLMDSISPGNYPKFCSLALVEGDQWPEDWQGSALTCDFRAHRIVRFGIEDRDSGYATRELPDVLRTTNVTFRPIDIKSGPDGAFYVADWSNPIIQHGEVDFRDPRRDHEHGRIWRISHTAKPPARKQNLRTLQDPVLLANLTSPSGYLRAESRRVLIERSPSILPVVEAWEKGQSDERAKLEALWFFEAFNTPRPELLKQLLHAANPKVRAAATRVAGEWAMLAGQPTQDYLAWLGERATDDHPRVRLEAVRALAASGSAQGATYALQALSKPMDGFLDYALWLTMNDLAGPWTDAIVAGTWSPEGRHRELEFGLKAIEPAHAGKVLSHLLGNKPLPQDGSGGWIELIGRAGTTANLDTLYTQILSGGFAPGANGAAIAALSHAARQRGMRPTARQSEAVKLLAAAKEQATTLHEAVRLCASWQLADSAPALAGIAADASTSGETRAAACDALREIGGKAASEALEPLTSKEHPMELRRLAVAALAGVDPAKAGPLAVRVGADLTSDQEALALWRALLGIKGSSAHLVRALPASGYPAVAARAGLRAAREGNRNEPELVLALTEAAGLEDSDVGLSPAEIQEMVQNVISQGSAERGERVYRRQTLGCINCHSIAGAGGKVGPDLASIGASAQPDYIVESILYPNRKVKEGYHAVLIETKDDQEFSGVLSRETPEELVLREASNQEIHVAKPNVKTRTMGGSLMPTGLLDGLPQQDRLDLVRFLSELGKPGKFDASKTSVARLWKIAPGTHTLEQFGVDRLLGEALATKDWIPVLAQVDGAVQKDDLKEAATVEKYVSLVSLYAGVRLEVARPGNTRFELEGADSAPAWIDGKALEGGARRSANLAPGTHTLVLKLDARSLPGRLKVQAPDATFLAN